MAVEKQIEKRTTVGFTIELWDFIEDVAKVEKRSQASVIREAVGDFMNKRHNGSHT